MCLQMLFLFALLRGGNESVLYTVFLNGVGNGWCGHKFAWSANQPDLRACGAYFVHSVDMGGSGGRELTSVGIRTLSLKQSGR